MVFSICEKIAYYQTKVNVLITKIQLGLKSLCF